MVISPATSVSYLLQLLAPSSWRLQLLNLPCSWVANWQIVGVPRLSVRPIEVNNETHQLPAFTERPVWHAIGNGWCHLHGSVSGAGLSFEWHNFTVAEEFNWGKSFHPGSIEVCLNREGNGRVGLHKREATFTPLTIGFYRRGDEALPATREAKQQHQFLTVEMSFDFLRRHLGEFVTSLHPLVRDVVSGQSEKSAVAPTMRLTTRQSQLVASLRQSAGSGNGSIGLVSSQGVGTGGGTVFYRAQ